MNTKYNLLGFVLLLLSIACGNDEETYQVVEQPLNVAVYASGKVMPMEYADIQSNMNAKILKFLVKPGDTVREGQTLAILGSTENQEQIAYLKDQVNIIEQQTKGSSDVLQQIEEQINIAENQYQQDQQNANRYVKLAKDTAVSKEMAENMQLIAQKSYSDFQNLKRELAVKKQDLNAQLLQLKSSLKSTESRQSSNVLSSIVNGVVLSIKPNVGDNVSPNETILFIGTPHQYLLDLIIDERDVTKIKMGQKVIFQTDAYGKHSFNAQISQIDPVLEENTRSFRVKAKVTSDTLFYAKTSVEANVIIRSEPKILMIPKDYLLEGDSLWLKEGDNKRKIAIKSRIVNNDKVEILAGIKENDLIIKPEQNE